MARGSGNGDGKGRARKGRPIRDRKAEAAWRLKKKEDPSYLPDAGGNCDSLRTSRGRYFSGALSG